MTVSTALRIVSADCHVDEPHDLLDALPDELGSLKPTFVERDGQRFRAGPGTRPMRLEYALRYGAAATDEERTREFRDDPTGGRDPQRRLSELAADGVYAEVIYPNRFLYLTAHPDPLFQVEACRLYNDLLDSTFGDQPDRFAPAALLPAIDIRASIVELERVARLGFRSAMMPISIPWLPYGESDYDPLWSAFEETGLLCAFHVFTGNLAYFADFADPLLIPLDRLEGYRARSDGRGFEETLSTTVVGCVAAMGPLLHLTGSAALERHPSFRFVLAECEAGWLAWTLLTMDRMQARRHHGLHPLALRPSEYFKRQGYATFSDDPVAMRLVDLVGADRLMWSNDYPHDEGTYPISATVIERTMGHLDRSTRDQLTSKTAADLYGFSELWAATAAAPRA